MEKSEGKYAWTVTVGEKGQIVIPKQAREIFKINPGDTLMILGDESRGWLSRPKVHLLNLRPLFLKHKQMKKRANKIL